jgi:hypothetical protein
MQGSYSRSFSGMGYIRLNLCRWPASVDRINIRWFLNQLPNSGFSETCGDRRKFFCKVCRFGFCCRQRPAVSSRDESGPRNWRPIKILLTSQLQNWAVVLLGEPSKWSHQIAKLQRVNLRIIPACCKSIGGAFLVVFEIVFERMHPLGSIGTYHWHDIPMREDLQCFKMEIISVVFAKDCHGRVEVRAGISGLANEVHYIHPYVRV